MKNDLSLNTFSVIMLFFTIWIYNELLYLFEQKDLMSMIDKSYNNCTVNYIIEAPHMKGISCVKNNTLYMIALKDIHWFTYTKSQLITRINNIK